MTDPHEIEALKASMRGALSTAGALAAIGERVAAIDPHGDVPAADIEELARLSLAHALAAQALRGLVETIRSRRSEDAGDRNP